MRLSAPRLIVLLALIGCGLAACESCRSAPSAVAPPPPTVFAGPPTVRLYLVSDLAGALEPCGCTRDQQGGLDRFGAWVRRDRATARSSLVAAAGPLFFMDPQLPSERADQDRTKADTIARVLRRLDLAAFAPGINDWADGPQGLGRLAGEAGARALVPGAAGAPFASAVVRDAGGVRVGFVGYAGADAGDAAEVEAAVREGIGEARAQGANVLVALVAVGRGEAKRIADAIPELSAVVVGSAKESGDSNTAAPPGERVGNVVIAQGANHLQSVAVLDLYVREPVTPGHLLKFADGTGLEHDSFDRTPAPTGGSFLRYALQPISESMGKDAAILGDMAAYYKAVDDHNRVAFADRLPPPRAPGQPGYVGVDVCTTCHAAPRRVWDRTSHARAYGTLSSQFKEYNLECVGCHVTGYDKPGGSSVTHVDKLRNVQCEVCHGPGSAHVAAPSDPTKIVASPGGSVCTGCHHPPHVERFDVAAAMKGVLGPGHGA